MTSRLNDHRVLELCKESLRREKIGEGDKELQNGRDFYKFFFTRYPKMREYFHGAESISADDVQKSERFVRQGQRLLLSVHLLVESFENPMVFEALARDLLERHMDFKIPPTYWQHFFNIFIEFLEQKSPLDPETKKAWETLAGRFNNVSLPSGRLGERSQVAV